MANAIIDMIRQQLEAAPVVGLDKSPEQMRATYNLSASMVPPDPGVKMEPANIAGLDAHWLSVEGVPAERTIVFLHGGGYVIGSVETHRDLMGRIARASRARILGLNYRLAPEHPYPAAIDDAIAAYRWLLDSGTDPKQISLVGDSAGAGLALCTAIALREAKKPLPGAIAALSPWVDLSCEGATFATAHDPAVNQPVVQMLARFYAGERELGDPLLSPTHADLAGLPPTLIHVGGDEAILSDVEEFVAKANGAGVELECEVWPDMIHGWHSFAFMLPEGAAAIRAVGDYLCKQTG